MLLSGPELELKMLKNKPSLVLLPMASTYPNKVVFSIKMNLLRTNGNMLILRNWPSSPVSLTKNKLEAVFWNKLMKRLTTMKEIADILIFLLTTSKNILTDSPEVVFYNNLVKCTGISTELLVNSVYSVLVSPFSLLSYS